jgi:predicted lipoprotein with Yx(FWY)xxD motif
VDESSGGFRKVLKAPESALLNAIHFNFQEVRVRRPSLFAATAIAVVATAAAGCGSSSNSTSNAGGYAPVGTSSTQSAAASTATSTSAGAPATGTAAASGTGTAVVVSTKHAKLGTILAAGNKHLTVYMFEGDKGNSSTCTGACAKVWPPVTTSAAVSVGGAAVAADLGTITRPDGTKQVTYKGHPLYWFARDGDSGDAYGQGVVGFGSSWYVISPSGKKVDNS